MIIKRNIPTYSISWLSDKDGSCTGIINELYYPQTTEELVDLCQEFWSKDKRFYIFGHTSNSYFKPAFSPEIVISTLKLSSYSVLSDSVVAQCGAHLRKIAKDMVERGFVGFEGMIDIPGTIGAAVYGNAGAYGCEIANVVESVKFLDKKEGIVILSVADMQFSRRSSILKKGQKEGVILSVTLRMIHGDKSFLQSKSKESHLDRLRTQPGPQNNLGSCFVGGGGRKMAIPFAPQGYSHCFACHEKTVRLRTGNNAKAPWLQTFSPIYTFNE